MTEDKKRNFLQETAFEEDVNLDESRNKRVDSKSAVDIKKTWSPKFTILDD